VSLSAGVGAAPLFPDAPADHWASDALRALAARGLIEGYPDGTFKGDRAASRYEVAMILARFLAKMEQEHATFATKEELEAVRRLVVAMREELEPMGVRITNMEENTSRLDQRVHELERIRFYGRLQFAAVSNKLWGAPNIGSILNPGIDWSSGRLLTRGKGLSAAGTLGLNVDINEHWKAGGEFVAFTSQGSLPVDAYWGVSAPWLTNPWTGRGALSGGVQPDSNIPFTRMVLDNFWVRHIPSQTRLTMGAYNTERVAPFVLQGPRNPNIHRPRWLPFFGADLKGTIGGVDSGWEYEALYSFLPELANYQTRTTGGAVRYTFDRGHVRGTVINTFNRPNDDGRQLSSGLVALPTVPFVGPGAAPVVPNAWVDPRTGLARTSVGPQSETTYGIDARYRIFEDEKLDAVFEFAGSNYNPDTGGRLFNTTATDTLLRFGLTAEPIEDLSLGLDYFRVDPTYDPFIAAYPLPPGVPVFIPYGAYYSNYYQLHDYVNYPNNRQGFRFTGSYAFNDKATRVHLEASALQQVAASTPGQISKVGNIEPLFPLLSGGGAPLGHITSFGAGLGHRFDNGFRLNADYFRYNIRREATAIDDMDLAQDVVSLQMAYPFAREWTLRGSYYLLEYRGHTGLINTNFNQHIPGVGIDWEPAQATTLSLDYRYFSLNDRQFPVQSYEGSQVVMELKVDF